MRQHKILTRTLLLLSIINFALAAPAAVRERPEVRLDANVTRNVTAASQKRSVLRQMAEHMEQDRSIDSPPPPPDSPGSLTGSDYVPPSPGSPTGSQGPTGGSPRPSLPHPGPSEYRFLSPPGFPVNPDALSSTVHQPTPPQNPTGGSPLPHLGPSEGRFPSPPGWSANRDTLSSTGHQRTPPQSPTGGFPLPPLPHPGPSEDSFPPGFSANSDTLSSTGSTDYQPTPPQSPGVDPEIHSLLNPEPFPTEFWDKFLKGKIKRRISGSDAVNLAQKDPKSRIF